MFFLKKNFGIILVLLLSFWAIRPLFVSGFFPMHDDTQVARVFEMGKMLKDGIFPVRWVPDLGYGYGYPIFNFYAPLAYYVGALFILLGFDALTATKIMMGIGILLSGIFMYLLAREFWGEIGGVLSGLFYVYAPYHALDIYVRGDVAEFWAYAFVPLMFYGFYKLFKNSQSSDDLETENSKVKAQKSKAQFKIQKFGMIGALGYAGIILSHNLTALMITPFLLASFLILIIYSKKETRILTTLYLLLYTLLGLMLSAFYWIPALLEMKYTNVLSQIGGGADFRDHFVCLGQLWDSHWGFGGSAPGCLLDGMSFLIGKLHLFVIFITSLLSFRAIRQLAESRGISLKEISRQARNDNYDPVINNYRDKILVISLYILGFALSVFMTLEISKPIWEGISLMAFFQYPWRFLLLVSFFASFLAGSVLWLLQSIVSLRGGTTKQSHFKEIATLTFGKLRFARNDKLAKAVVYLSFGALIFLFINFNSKLFQPQTIVPKTVLDYTSEYALKWTASKISDEFLPPNFKKPESENEIAKIPAIKPQETALQKISNTITLSGIIILTLGIIIKDRKRLNV